MGVPVITLAGDIHAARVSASLLTSVGLSDLIASSTEEFVEVAKRLAADPARLAQLRAGMRERLRRSPLLDAPAFARNLEARYRRIWKTWCER
jgi:predicted O-linked N-acetylglucosamine transferase (SPINDLY family)